MLTLKCSSPPATLLFQSFDKALFLRGTTAAPWSATECYLLSSKSSARALPAQAPSPQAPIQHAHHVNQCSNATCTVLSPLLVQELLAINTQVPNRSFLPGSWRSASVSSKRTSFSPSRTCPHLLMTGGGEAHAARGLPCVRVPLPSETPPPPLGDSPNQELFTLQG